MRNQYIEKDGLLFARCEPQKLRLDSPRPCLVQRSDSKDYIVVSEHNIREIYKASHECIGYVSFQCSVPQLSEEVYVYAAHKIVAKHCPEGSAEWALWQMLNGKKVRNPAYEGETYSCGGKPYSCALFIEKEEKDGWYIYEEAAPEPKPKPEVGMWYKHKEYQECLQCVHIFDNYATFRKSGKKDDDVAVMARGYAGLTPASLEPDFSNAKEGDKCYSALTGNMEISVIREKDREKAISVLACNDSGLCARYSNSGIQDEDHIHPALFNSADQCAAYFAEVALKERGEK